MANKLYQEQAIQNIANSIRNKGARLPQIYQEVEYIQSLDNHCCINTGIKPTLNFEYEFVFEHTTTVTSNTYFFGTSADTNSPRLNIRYDANTDGKCVFFGQTSSGSALTIGSYQGGLNNKIDSICSGNYDNSTVSLTINKELIATKTYSPNVDYTANIRFFNYSSNTSAGVTGLKVYYFELKNNGILVRKMIPCYRKFDNVIGMYDLVEKEFYENVGTGAFTKGSDVTISSTFKVSEMSGAIDDLEIVNGETKTIAPTTSQQIIIPSSGKNAITQITVNAVTSAIDSNIQAENIKKDVSILGITGNYEGSGGGSGVVNKGVFFLDYDGEVVEAWETSSVTSKTALPNNPTHTGLVAEGWNWTLANIKSYIASYPNADVYVGQMYHTASGLTEIDITVTKVTGLTVTCNMVGNKNWGDGTSDNLTTHTYTDYGDYTITCDGTSIPAGSSSSGGMFGSSSDVNNMNRYWCTAIRLSNSVTSIGNYAFRYCCSLTSISLPDSVTSIGSYTFYDCYSLTSISLPDSVTSIKSSTFYDCYSLTSISFPEKTTTLGDSALDHCSSLTSIIIPKNLIYIGQYTFSDCYSIIEYDFTKLTTVPSLRNVGDTFSQINRICKIRVPDSLYNDWKTRWSSNANYIYKASEV